MPRTVTLFVDRLVSAFLMFSLLTWITYTVLFYLGDPIDLLADPRLTTHELNTLREQMGLHGGYFEQFCFFIKTLVTGPYFQSFIYQEPPLHLILERLPSTFELIIPGLLISLAVGVPCGIYLAGSKGYCKKVLSVFVLLGFSIPTYITGLVFIWFFAIHTHLFPSFGRGAVGTFFGLHSSFFTLDGLWHLFLPLLTLTLYKTSLIARTVRTSATLLFRSAHVQFANARGLTRTRITIAYILKGLLGTILTLTVLEFGGLIAYSVMIEMLYAWPGVGKLLIDSILALDRPVVLTYVLFVAAFYLILTSIADSLHTLVDPRLNQGRYHV